MWTSTTGGDYHGGYSTGPWIDAYRTSDGAIVHRTYSPDAFSSTVDISSMWPKAEFSELDWYRINGIDIKSKEELPKMKVYEDKDAKSLGRKYAVACSHEPDLSQEHILKCISVMKAKLMMQCAPVKVMNIECKMTPAVKHNIITAWKRLDRYGKKPPFVARYDEYGRRLSDEIKIDTLKGMTIKIVNPEDYGPYHLEFEGLVYDATIYQPTWDYGYTSSEDVPF